MQAAGRIDEATGQRYNQGSFLREVVDEFFAAKTANQAVNDEQFEELKDGLERLGLSIRHDLAQFYKAVLLYPDLIPENAAEIIPELLDRMFPDRDQ